MGGGGGAGPLNLMGLHGEPERPEGFLRSESHWAIGLEGPGPVLPVCHQLRWVLVLALKSIKKYVHPYLL